MHGAGHAHRPSDAHGKDLWYHDTDSFFALDRGTRTWALAPHSPVSARHRAQPGTVAMTLETQPLVVPARLPPRFRHRPRRSVARCLALTLVLALASGWATSLAATQSGEAKRDWQLEPLQWSTSAEKLTSIVVINLYGAIRVEGVSGPSAETAELHGMVQRHVDDPRTPQIAAIRQDHALRIEIRYPGDAAVAEPPDAWRKRRTDITLYLPATVELRIETLHGSGRVEGISGSIDAASESGDLEIETARALTAKSNHGSLRAVLTAAKLPSPIQLETVSGEIHLFLPWDAEPEARLETRGEIASDYSTEITWLPGSTLKQGSVTARAEHQPIVLRSNRGDIHLLRRIQARKSALPVPTAERKRE